MPYYCTTVIMGRLIADQENTITVPVHVSDESVVIDMTTMALYMGHQVFNKPHIVGYNGGVTYLDNRRFREYLEQSPPHLAHYYEHDQTILIHLTPPYPGIAVIRMHATPTEIVG